MKTLILTITLAITLATTSAQQQICIDNYQENDTVVIFDNNAIVYTNYGVDNSWNVNGQFYINQSHVHVINTKATNDITYHMTCFNKSKHIVLVFEYAITFTSGGNIKFPPNTTHATLYNLSGRLISDDPGSYIPADLPPGIYILNMIISGHHYSYKLWLKGS